MEPISMIALGARFLPGIIRWAAGDEAGKVAEDVAGAAAEIFGTADPDRIETAIAADPALALRFKEKLLDVQDAAQRREHERFLAELEDRQGARGIYDQSKSVVNGLTRLIVAAFFAVNGLALVGFYFLLSAPEGTIQVNEATLAVVALGGTILGWVNSKTDMVISFFFGSSSGSKNKEDQLGGAVRDLVRKAGGGG